MQSDRNRQQDYELLLAEESFILEAQILIQSLLNEKDITQAELARRLGVGESYISQMLGASARNLTLRTIARVLDALDEEPQLTAKSRSNVAPPRVQELDYEARAGTWGELMILDAASEGEAVGWFARDWAANENTIALPEMVEAA